MIEAGRARWNIKESFNNQKNDQYRIEHLNSRNSNVMKNHCLLTQMADILMQLYLGWCLLIKQTVEEENGRRLRIKEAGGLHSSMLQNPSNQDATFREKSRKEHQGYVANLKESVGASGKVITDYEYKQKTYSDSQFLKGSLNRMPKQEEEKILIMDGAYNRKGNRDQAAGKNIHLVTTGLSGKSANDILADFVFNEEGKVY